MATQSISNQQSVKVDSTQTNTALPDTAQSNLTAHASNIDRCADMSTFHGGEIDLSNIKSTVGALYDTWINSATNPDELHTRAHLAGQWLRHSTLEKDGTLHINCDLNACETNITELPSGPAGLTVKGDGKFLSSALLTLPDSSQFNYLMLDYSSIKHLGTHLIAEKISAPECNITERPKTLILNGKPYTASTLWLDGGFVVHQEDLHHATQSDEDDLADLWSEDGHSSIDGRSVTHQEEAWTSLHYDGIDNPEINEWMVV